MTTTKERPVRARPAQQVPRKSTRAVRSTRAVAEDAERSPRPSTRKPRTVTKEAPKTSSAPKRMIRSEAVPQVAPPTTRRSTRSTRDTEVPPKVGQSTRHVIRTEPSEVTRTEIFTEKREQARFLAPAKFLVAMFGVVVVSVFAFGLLREDAEEIAAEPAETNQVIEFEPHSTSTNTGILRGSNGE